MLTRLRLAINLRVTVSELSGKQNIILKAKELGLDLSAQDKEVQKLLEQVKTLESLGFQYDQAEASFRIVDSPGKTGLSTSLQTGGFYAGGGEAQASAFPKDPG